MKAPQRPRGPIGPADDARQQQQQQQDNKNNNGAGVDDPPTGADYTEFIAALRFTSPRRTIRCPLPLESWLGTIGFVVVLFFLFDLLLRLISLFLIHF